jgi:AhpD family alkylhydroperoxidase
MPHAPPLPTDEAGEARTTLETLQAKLGQVPNMYRTFAHAPRILDAAVSMAQAIRSDLDAKLRELAYLKVTHMTDCHVCWHYHEAAACRAGVTEQQIRDLGSFEDSDAYSGLEKDTLRFAEQWTLGGRVADDVMTRLKAALSPAHLVILAATAAQANFTTRFNNVFGVELP